MDIVLNRAFFLKPLRWAIFAYRGEVHHFCLPAYKYTRARTFHAISLHVRVYTLRGCVYSWGHIASMRVTPRSPWLLWENGKRLGFLPDFPSILYCSMAIHYGLTGQSITTHAYCRVQNVFVHICPHRPFAPRVFTLVLLISTALGNAAEMLLDFVCWSHNSSVWIGFEFWVSNNAWLEEFHVGRRGCYK